MKSECQKKLVDDFFNNKVGIFNCHKLRQNDWIDWLIDWKIYLQYRMTKIKTDSFFLNVQEIKLLFFIDRYFYKLFSFQSNKWTLWIFILSNLSVLDFRLKYFPFVFLIHSKSIFFFLFIHESHITDVH